MTQQLPHKLWIAGVAAVALTACTASEPRVVQMAAPLNATQEVPPTNSPGNGRATVTFDRETRQMSWKVDYAGLTGPLQAAHFHGPAAPGANAGVMVPIQAGPSPLSGSAVLTEPQAQALLNGQLYVNLHTPQFPGGEIRGQVVRAVTGSSELVPSGSTAPYYVPSTPPQMGEPTIRRY